MKIAEKKQIVDNRTNNEITDERWNISQNETNATVKAEQRTWKKSNLSLGDTHDHSIRFHYRLS